MTQLEQDQEIAAGEYAQAHRASYGYPTYICLVDAFLAGSRWMEQQKEVELQVARRDKDMAWLAYMATKDQQK